MNNKHQLPRVCRMGPNPLAELSPRALAVWLCAATVFGVSGCTTMHTIEAPAAQESWTEIQADDAVTLTLRNGREIETKFVKRTSQAVIGLDASGASLTIESTDIEYAKVKRFSAGRSVSLGAAIVSVGFAAAAADVGESVTDSLTR